MRGKKGNPKDITLIVVYILSKELGISPLEINQMPASLIIDLLEVHKVMSELEAEELEKLEKKTKTGVNKGNFR